MCRRWDLLLDGIKRSFGDRKGSEGKTLLKKQKAIKKGVVGDCSALLEQIGSL